MEQLAQYAQRRDLWIWIWRGRGSIFPASNASSAERFFARRAWFAGRAFLYYLFFRATALGLFPAADVGLADLLAALDGIVFFDAQKPAS